MIFQRKKKSTTKLSGIVSVLGGSALTQTLLREGKQLYFNSVKKLEDALKKKWRKLKKPEKRSNPLNGSSQ